VRAAGHLLPDRGPRGDPAVPALPGRALRALLQVGHPGHAHVRLRPVAGPAAGARGPDPRGAAGGHLQLAHRDRARRAGAGPLALPAGPAQAPAPGRRLAAVHGRGRRQPARRVPDLAHGGRRARGGREPLHGAPARARRLDRVRPPRHRALAAGLPAHRLQEPPRGPEAPVARRRLEHHGPPREHVPAQPARPGRPHAVPHGLCARGPLRQARRGRRLLPELQRAQRLAARARHAPTGLAFFFWGFERGLQAHFFFCR
jgi:hypothetical protein